MALPPLPSLFYDLFLPFLLLLFLLLFLFYFHLYSQHDSSVNIVTRLKTEHLSNQVLVHAGGKVFSLCYLDFGTVPASYPVGARGS